ncbi:uncharacterized protein [Coffea arabica]|uniref:Endonuclease/exonuclease/phosphatase domain-containing protein n=1 Tax=Coffea arabica TaxID=13443 RepID=A0ABM4UQV9_COFAR
MKATWVGITLNFSAVYAKCTRVGRRELWRAMEEIARGLDGPWMVAGDFNVISKAEERLGGAPPNLRNMEEFNDIVFNCRLLEVSFDGSTFTWTNGSMWQRLDRALANEASGKLFQTIKVSHLMCGRSDHAPLLIKCGSSMGRGSAFRFLNMWRRHPKFLEVVREAWRTPVSGRGMVGFYVKLSQAKAALRNWNAQVFGNLFQNVSEAEKDLQQKEQEYDLMRDPTSRATLGEARARHARALTLEREYWKQKSTVKWIQLGDANTKIFHSVVKQRRSMNFIARVKEENGQSVEDEEGIKASAAQYFARFFSMEREGRSPPVIDGTLPTMSLEENKLFLRMPTVEKLKEMVFALPVDSAAGPDGFGAGFYQGCWDIIHPDLLLAVHDFFKGA